MEISKKNSINQGDKASDNVKVEEVLSPLKLGEIELPLYIESVAAGFPSPADDYIESRLDLNDLLVRNPSATYFVRVSGDSLLDYGVHNGDILVVDRSKTPKEGSIIVAVLNGELLVKVISFNKNKIYLMPENSKYEPLEITKSMGFEVWGVVTTVIHSIE